MVTAMNPRTHPRGAPPNFSMTGLPPKPNHTTDALWWLVQMRLRLEPRSKNGGTFANKAGSHNTGHNLLTHKDNDGDHSWANDHSIRHEWNRTGPWWKDYCAAHDWTFDRAHTGNFTEINLYTHRMLKAMRDPKDLRPDRVMFYCLGQEDGDSTVEGWHELRDEIVSGDDSHLWHRHDSLFRNIVGSFDAMWKILTIDMGWTYAEYLRSVSPQEEDDMDQAKFDELMDSYAARKNTLKVSPWQQEVGRTGKSTHDVLFGSMKATAESTLAAVVALSNAFANYVVAENTEDADTDAMLADLRTQLTQARAALDAIAEVVIPGDGPTA